MWKKYLIVAVFVLVLVLVAGKASAQAITQSERDIADSTMWKNAASEAWGEIDGRQEQGIEEIVRSFGVHGDGDHRKLIYILATAWHEAKLRPVKERRANKDRQPGLYELQSKYWPSGYYGRGYVQLTWESNYQKMGDFIGADLVSTPDLALQPRYAAEIIVYGMMNGSFTGRKLGSYITLLSADYRNARRVVNATDQAGLIRDYALQLQAEFQKA